jgi:hypothetical protein
MNKTIFLDIDGCIFKHHGNLTNQIKCQPVLLDGVTEKINEWNEAGYMIILVTGRKECMRELTIKQLLDSGVYFDQLIMGLPRGERVIINDKKPETNNSLISTIKIASAIQLVRNEGLKNINI